MKSNVSIGQTSIYSGNDSPNLKKRFNIWSTSALQFSLICSSLAIGTFLSTVIGVGGSPVLIYGFILAVTFDLFICFSLAELASAYPHSSAQVHWTYVLAPVGYKKVLSFITGILSCAAWIFASFSSTYVAGSFIFSLVQVYHPDFIPSNWQFYLVYCAIILTGYSINAFSVVIIPYITNSLVGVINIGTLFILITLLVKANPKQSADFVFKDIINETGWNSNGVVFFLGLLPSIASVTLYDGACHMTDEIDHPEKNIPLVMIISNVSSAVLAFISAVVYMFCVVNVPNLTNPIGGQPIVQLMIDCFQSRALSTIGVLILIFTFTGSSYTYYTTTSRLFWSFAQSNGIPYGKFFGQVSPKFKVPLNALSLTTVICLILGLIILGSSSALNAVLGSSMICINLSYIFPILCLLFNSGFSWNVKDRYNVSNDNVSIPPAVNEKTNLPHFHLGKIGLVLNVASVFWASFIMVWLNFPTISPVSSDNMNYCCVVLGVTCFLGIIFWFATGKREYNHEIDVKHEL